MRAATAVAGALACAAAAMAAAAFVVGDDEGERAASAPEPAPASAAARDGKAVWVANGCGSCHTFLPANARATFGPNLAATLKGMPAAYRRASLGNPGAVAAAGWEGGMMPEDFGARIRPEELDALVEFIRSSVRD